MSEPLSASETWAVVITGVVVVFVILVILVGLCTLMSRLIGAKTKKPADPPKPAAPAPVPAAAQKVSPAPVESGIPGEVIAAISAAVSCMMGPDQKFAIRSVRVRSAKGERPAWNAAGIAENTRPF